MNKFIAIGNLCADPELSETAGGVAICKFRIAVQRRRTSDGETKTDFFDCVAWRGTAEAVARYAKKGNKLAIVGDVQLRHYEGRDGVQRLLVDVNVSDVEFLTPRPATGEQPQKPAKPSIEAFDDDSDIPF